jgi:SAM-dependent methyltransferase
MPGRYEFSYTPNSVYGHAVALVERVFGCPAGGECIVDLGCGYGAIAEQCTELGYTYVGFDLEPDSAKAVRNRGFEAHTLDLRDFAGLAASVAEAIGDRSIAGIVMLDTLEHIIDSVALLEAIRGLLANRPPAPLVLSVPNVTHLEIAAKLLQGRWDVTEVGLLDDTHVTFFSAARLSTVARGAGWLEIAENDYRLNATDQHFPSDDVSLLPDTPIQHVLELLRAKSEPCGTVNQFVRAYLPGPVKAESSEDDSHMPFLSVLTRTQGKRPDTLQETLLCLAAQECTDFECLVLAHDVSAEVLGDLQYLLDTLPANVAGQFRLIPVMGGGRSRPLNVGLEHARGRYVAILDDDDLAFAHWVGEFKTLSEERPGRVLRAGVVTQEAEHGRWLDRLEYRNIGGFNAPYPSEFDLLDHLVENHSPPCGLAFPRSAFRDLGITFDENLPVLEDWDVLLQAAMFCGVVNTAEVTSVYRWWPKADCSLQRHSKLEWQSARSAVVRRMDSAPFILPSGGVSQIRTLIDERNSISDPSAVALREEVLALQARVNELTVANNELTNQCEWLSITAQAANEGNQRRLEELTMEFHHSTSWRVTAPLRALASRRVRP